MNAPVSDSRPSWSVALDTYSEALHDQWIQIRRHLHQHPELSDGEFETTQYLVEQLDRLGLPTHVAGQRRGLTADLITSTEAGEGKRIAIRGDIDALPIQDTKAVDYRSKCAGVMHACGHDAHAAIVIGAMQLLSAMHGAGKLPWPIAVRAILQPAEELATGAKHMIHHHALADVDSILGLHVDPTRRVGCIGLRAGLLTAACDSIDVSFVGQGGHGARPHLSQDPIDACTHWVQSAYRRISRTVNAHETVVFSVGQIHAGHSANVIPDQAKLSGSLRSLDRHSRQVALKTLEDVSEAIQKESGCQVSMNLGFSAPAVDNDQATIDRLEQSIQITLGGGAVEWIDQPSMGSEDFSYYLEQVPGAMFRLGVAGDQVGSAPLHTAAFDIDERAIAIGSKVMAATVIHSFAPEGG